MMRARHLLMIATVAVGGCATTPRPSPTAPTSTHVVDRSPDIVTACLAKGYGVAPRRDADGTMVVTWTDAKGRMLRDYRISPTDGGSLVEFRKSTLPVDKADARRREGWCIAIQSGPA